MTHEPQTPHNLTIWIDADACPRTVKDILFRAARRRRIAMVLVANQPVTTPPGTLIRAVQVGQGFDVADNYIVEALQPGDLVITADIPLAAEVIAKGAAALNPRGELYTTSNIRQRLTMRNFMDEMRGAGVNTGGPAPLNAKNTQAFANSLDRWLARYAPPYQP